MAIRFVSDLGAPVVVAGVDLITEATKPAWNEWAAYILAIGGYVGSFMGWGGDFTKNIGIAAFPLAAKKVYDRVTAGGTSKVARMSLKRTSSMSRYPGPAAEAPFQGVKLV